MKLSSITLALSSILAFSSSVIAAEDVVDTSDFVPSEEKPFNFRIEYSIKDKQTHKHEIVEVVNGEVPSLEYRFFNGEEFDVAIVGVGGQLLDPQTGVNLANVTATELGPLAVPPGGYANFTHNIGIDLLPKTYLFVPAIYIFQQNQLAVLGSRNQLITVTDPEISIFNPKLLFLELVLLATVGAIAYFGYTSFGYKYVQKAQKKSVASSGASTPSSSTSTGAKTVDQSWLPQTHLKTKKTKKAN